MTKKQSMGTNAAKLTKYAFVLGSAATLIGRAAAQTAAQFTFEVSGTAAGSTGGTSGMLTAEVGTGTAIGVHASAATVYSFPAGFGSTHAFSSTAWASGDYYQFSVSALAFTSAYVSFDMARSSTGPSGFSLQYSTSGSTGGFVSLTTFTASGVSFSTSATNGANAYSFDLSTVAGLSNNANDVFRLVSDGTNSSGGVVAAGGTDRVDNFTFGPMNAAGTPLPVPEPSTLALFSVAGAGVAMMITRRRKRA